MVSEISLEAGRSTGAGPGTFRTCGAPGRFMPIPSERWSKVFTDQGHGLRRATGRRYFGLGESKLTGW